MGEIHRWRLDETSGNGVADSVGGVDYTLANGSWTDPGRSVPGALESLGTAYNPLSTTGFAQGATISLSGEFTIGVWFRKNAAAQNRFWLGQAVGTNKMGFLSGNNFFCRITAGGASDSSITPVFLGPNNWHLALVRRNADNTVDVSFDGGTWQNLPGIGTDAGASQWGRIGRDDGSGWFDGDLDDVRIWDHALTQAEAQAVFRPVQPEVVNNDLFANWLKKAKTERVGLLTITDSTGYTAGGIHEGYVRGMHDQAGIEVVGGFSSAHGGQSRNTVVSSADRFRVLRGAQFTSGADFPAPANHEAEWNLGLTITGIQWRYGNLVDGNTNSPGSSDLGRIESSLEGAGPIDVRNELKVIYVHRLFAGSTGQFVPYARSVPYAGGTNIDLFADTPVSTAGTNAVRAYHEEIIAADPARGDRYIDLGYNRTGQPVTGECFLEAVGVLDNSKSAGVIYVPYIAYGGQGALEIYNDMVATGAQTRKNFLEMIKPYLGPSNLIHVNIEEGQNSVGNGHSASTWIGHIGNIIGLLRTDESAANVNMLISVTPTFQKGTAADTTLAQYRQEALTYGAANNVWAADTGDAWMSRSEIIEAGGNNGSGDEGHPDAPALGVWWQRGLTLGESGMNGSFAMRNHQQLLVPTGF